MHILNISYFDGRKQLNNVGGYESTWEKKLGWGTTRLSARAVINLTHINDLENNTCLNVLNFVDDTMLYKTFTKDTYLYEIRSFNTELSKVSDWLIVNKLKRNPNET